VLDRLVSWDPGPRLNPLLATVFLFGAQSVILGTASPIAVRLLGRSVERLGRTAGRLFAVSTAGSIAGTFATSFWLIPELGTDQVLASAAVALMLAAAAVALVERLALAGLVTLALAGASVGAVVSLAPEGGGTVAASQLRNWSPVYRLQAAENRQGSIEEGQEGYTILHTEDSQYHRIAVVEDDRSRYLRFDSSFQSGMFKDDPFATRFDYSDYLQLPFAYRPDTKRVLYIGLGGGSATKRAWRDFPSAQLDAVELDPAVVDVAYEYFALPRDPRIDVTVEDGRRFLAQNEGPWDAIVVDAFYSDSIPFHLATREFLELARSRLTPGGVVATNIIGAVRGAQSRLFRSMLRTYRSVFPTVAVHPVGEEAADLIRNIILVASEGAAPSKEFLRERWADVRKRSPGAPDLRGAIDRRVDEPIATNDVPVLTDAYAPTDALLLLFD
jgi:spermidine synthase